MRGVRRFTDLRAWQACDLYRKAIYRLIDSGDYGNDWKRRSQLEESACGPADHVAEGFGRFNPPDFARFMVMARSSLMESQSQLRDAVNKRYVTDETRTQLDALAETALEEVTGLMEYLQSPEALRNARRARERRIASRPERLANRRPRPDANPPAPESRENPRNPKNPEDPENPENPENSENPKNPEPRTQNPEPRTRNPEPGTEPEHEPSTEKPEA